MNEQIVKEAFSVILKEGLDLIYQTLISLTPLNEWQRCIVMNFLGM